jgi:hypothetical protein
VRHHPKEQVSMWALFRLPNVRDRAG